MTEPRPREQRATGEHYWSRDYNSKERFCSFWHQVDETLSLEPETVLEVGPGSGIVTYCLRHAGIQMTTVDLDAELSPDVVGSVTQLPLADGSFDAVLCCEVLEHLPWEEAEAALGELARVTRKGVVLSLPDVTPWMGKSYPLYFGLYAERARGELGEGRVGPILRAVRGQARWRDVLWTQVVPRRWAVGSGALQLEHPPIPHRAWRHEFDGEHHWEIGTAGYPVERVREAIRAAGLTIAKEFRVPENPWHRFFVLWPAGGGSAGYVQ